MYNDIIILSNTKNVELYGNTQRTLNTLKWSETEHHFTPIIVETNKNYLDQGFIYDENVIIPNEKFGYNKFLNYGLKESNSEWVIVANNDLIFTKKWFTKLMDFHKVNTDCLSLSPWEPNWHIEHGLSINQPVYFGYRTSFEITGWCLVIHRSVIQKCGLFDSQFEYWYQDNDYALTLQKFGIKHALITNSRVYHMISQ